MKRRLVIVTALGAAALALSAVAGEWIARSAIDRRLAGVDAGDLHASFAGDSALVAMATGRIDLTVTVTADELAARIGDRAGVEVSDIELSDGAVGITTSVGARGLKAVAWVTLSPADDGLEATIVSIEARGLQLPPAVLLGDQTTFTLPDPLTALCPDASVDAISVTSAGVELTLTATRDMTACLKQEEA